jgi:hypothetical protein
MSGYNEYLAEESFRNLKRNMEKGREGLITWEENMLLIENELAIFKGNTFEVLQMRKHIMHCSHFVSFEDFVFLTLGPLENGVYYKTDYHEKLKNRERNSCRLEYKKALEMIVGFPEFDKWLFGGKGPQVGQSFVEEIAPVDTLEPFTES